MSKFESPIDVVVDRIAASVARAWDAAKFEKKLVVGEEQAGFLMIAYRYLSARQSAIYRLEREMHLRDVQSRYQRAPSNDELYGEAQKSRPFTGVFTNLLIAVLASASAFMLIYSLAWMIGNLSLLIKELGRILIPEQFIMLVLSASMPAAVAFIAKIILRRPIEYAFAGIDPIHWQHYQTQSSKQIESERALILKMAGEMPGGSLSDGGNDDDNLIEAKENPVPVQPGMTEYVFSTGRLKIEDLGNDFREEKRRNTVVFWASFTTFLLVVLSGVASALFLEQDLKAIGGIGVISGVIGIYSYKILGKARLARIALTLFESYVIELQQRMDELALVPDGLERRKLRAAAWTNFRLGLNRLYSLEDRSANIKIGRGRNEAQ